MLITVAGAQGSGKSTVLKEIEKLGFEVVQRKTSRSILQDWGKTLDEINNDPVLALAFQDEILKRKIEDEWEAVNSSNIIFTERTYMDLFVYALVNLGKFNEHDAWINSYYERCVAAQETYEQVFYLKSGLFSVQADGVRGANPHYSKLVDLVLEHYTVQSVKSEKLSILDLVNVDDRVDYIKSKLPV